MINSSIQCPEEESKATQACIDLLVCDTEGGFPPFDCQSFVIQEAYSQKLILSLSITSKRILNELLEEAESCAFPSTSKHNSYGPWKRKDKILAVETVCSLDWEGSSCSVRGRKLKEESNSFWTTTNPNSDKKPVNSLTTKVGNGLQLTGIDWGSAGSTSTTTGAICASYEINDNDKKKENQQYCQGALVVWNSISVPMASGGTADNPPSFVFEFDSQLTCVAGHPHLPNVFGSGSKSGEVLLVDFNQEHPLVAVSPINCYCHIESISDIQWYFNHVKKEWLLCSTSPDGKVLFWQSLNNFKYPVQGFRLELNGKRLGGSKLSICKSRSNTSSYSSSSSHTEKKDNTTTFVIGCDCGVVLHVQQTLGPAPAMAGGGGGSRKGIFKCRWTYHAMQLISCLAEDMQTKIIHRAEERARLQKQESVDCSTIFEMNPPWNVLYPSIAKHSSCQSLTSHNGRVTAVHVNDGAVLSSGMDGIVYVYLYSSMTGDGRAAGPSSEGRTLVEPLVIETRDMCPITDASFLPVHVRLREPAASSIQEVLSSLHTGAPEVLMEENFIFKNFT